jgi:hypothetical protein
MQGARDDLLTRPTLACNQDGGATGACQFNRAADLPHLPAFADQQVVPVLNL